MPGKSKRDQIKLISTESAYFYTTSVNKANQAGTKLERMKFDPTPGVRKHVMFKQAKIK